MEPSDPHTRAVSICVIALYFFIMADIPLNIPNCFYRVSVKALITNNEGKFLLIRENVGKWELPGGGLDF